MSQSVTNSVEGQQLSSNSYLVKVLEGVRNLRAQNAFCDVTVEAEGFSFPAHKIILASASSYCRALFVGNAASTGKAETSRVKLKQVSATGLKHVLNFIYSNKLDLSLNNVQEVLKAAESLLVREALKLCFQFLEDSLNQKTCFYILNITRKFGPEELKQKALSYTGQQYKQLLEDHKHLVELDQATLCEILERNDIQGYSELELFNCAMVWLHHDERRLKIASNILKRIRFPLIPVEDLQNYVQEVSIMKTDSDCYRYLQEALCYHSQPYAQPVLQSKRTQPRSHSLQLLILGGRTTNNLICSDIWLTDDSCSGWTRIGEICTPVYNHCVAEVNNFVFVIGGQHAFDVTGKQSSNKVFRFDPRSSSWLEVAGMLEKRTRFHAGVLADHIFATAGGTLLGNLTNTVEEYKPAENKWEFTAPFPIAVADHAGTTHKGILYISGGFSSGRALNGLYSYLPRLQCWVSNSSMTFARCDHGMATNGENIYCVGGRTLTALEEWLPVNEMEFYCPVTDQWTTLKVPPFDCCQFSITAYQSKLFITGGGSLCQMTKKDGVFVYDPQTRKWEKAGSLPSPLVDHASCIVKLAGERKCGKESIRPLTGAKKKSTHL
uniref:BTB domain-containing protein n=1 Tax=Latimeria chalumnae TaxID=7897 RepID=H3BC68_LATCH